MSSFENNTSVNLNLAKENLHRNECRKWQREVEVVPKLRYYNMFKGSYAVENFVVSIQNRKKRSILSQFRYSILQLRLETGRFQDIPIEYRHCLFCDNLVESEIHFILHCPFYNEIRFELFDNVRKTYFYFDFVR